MNDPYNGRKPGCFDILIAFAATLALLLLIVGGLT